MKKLITKLLAVLGSVLLAVSLTAGKQASTLILKAELEKPIMAAGVQNDALIRITINAPETQIEAGQERNRMNLTVVLDRSRSMASAGKLTNAKAAAISALKMLGPNDIFSMVIYDSNVRTLIAPTPIKGNIEEITDEIKRIQPGGSTALFAGISVGANEVRKNLSDRYVNRVILLSDGLANIGPSFPVDLGRLGASLIKEGISVSTIGVGNDYNEDLMTSISQNSDGNFYFVENSRDLPMIFSKELDGALKICAKSIKIRIKCPEGIKPRGIIGRDCRSDGNNIELDFNQVYSGHQKSMILQLDVPPEGVDKKLTLASIDMAYRDLNGITQKIKTDVAATFSANWKDVEGNKNYAVMNTVALQQLAVEKQKAIREADNGNLREATNIIRNAAVNLGKVAEVTKDKGLQKEVQRSNREVEDLEEQAKAGKFDKSSRKRLKGQVFQNFNGQPYKQ